MKGWTGYTHLYVPIRSFSITPHEGFRIFFCLNELKYSDYSILVPYNCVHTHCMYIYINSARIYADTETEEERKAKSEREIYIKEKGKEKERPYTYYPIQFNERKLDSGVKLSLFSISGDSITQLQSRSRVCVYKFSYYSLYLDFVGSVRC